MGNDTQQFIKNKIKKNQCVTIHDFIYDALYSQNGYYNKLIPIGKNADFITAPEISQIFGEIIALYFISYYESISKSLAPNTKFNIHIVEVGAGKGTLMYDILHTIQQFPKLLDQNITISIQEISESLTTVQRTTLAYYQNHFNICWVKTLPELFQNIQSKKTSSPTKQIVFMVANELFDAFPIHQLEQTTSHLYERVITLDHNDNFIVTRTKELSSEVKEYLKKYEKIIVFPEYNQPQPHNNIIEINGTALDFINQIVKFLEGNIDYYSGLFIDYGYTKPQYQSTLQSLKNHQKNYFLENIATADITHLVDFHTIESLLQTLGFNKNNHCSPKNYQLRTQGEFLNSYAIELRTKILSKNLPIEEKNILQQGTKRLTHPSEMGDLFKFLIVNQHE